MPHKKSAKELTPEPAAPLSSSRRGSSASPEKPPGPLSIPVSAEQRDTIKVNNANATDLKNACDDALKRVRPPPYPGQRPFNRSSICRVRTCSNRYTSIRTCDSRSAGQACSSPQPPVSTAGKSTLSSPSPQFGPVSSCTCLVKARASSSSLTCFFL